MYSGPVFFEIKVPSMSKNAATATNRSAPDYLSTIIAMP
jgi:hypothetical protein